MPTVVLGSAKDIVETVGVARFLFVDFPLGNPAGAPYDRAMQADIARRAVSLFETATAPGQTVRAPVERPGDPDWRSVYNRIRPEDRAALLAEGDRRRERLAKIPPRGL